MWRRGMWGILALLVVLPPGRLAKGQASSTPHIWTVAGFDAKGDGRDAGLPDAAQLSYRYDQTQDKLWFRLALYGKLDKNAFGINIVMDTGTDPVKEPWWGGNKDFGFDRIVTAWVTAGPVGYEGTIGVADGAGAKARNLTNLGKDNVDIKVDVDAIVVGFKRTDVTEKMKFNVLAAVGSNRQWNDDIPNTGSFTIDLAAPRPARLREIDLSRDNLRLTEGYAALGENAAPHIAKSGEGRDALILIPGVYSGNDPFASFIARNRSRYTSYVVVPPGLGGTPPRSLPQEEVGVGDFPWTRLLERDIIQLVHDKHLKKPVLIVHGFPGSLAAEDLVSEHPDLFGGVIEIASMGVQPLSSVRDPAFKAAATPAERIETVNDGFSKVWFKYVTPETWDSNNYPAAMMSNDVDRAQRARREQETAALQVKIRYLCEFMASDHTTELKDLRVPVLVLRPGFNEKILSDPTTAWFKRYFLDVWEPFASNPNIRLVTINDARALILDDQPKLADDAIATFIEHLKALGKKEDASRRTE